MMPTRTRQWLSNRMSSHLEWPASRVADLKGDTTVSVVLPAKDEQETVGTIVTTIRESLVEQIPVVDEIVVIDSRSTDETAKVAARAGPRSTPRTTSCPTCPDCGAKAKHYGSRWLSPTGTLWSSSTLTSATSGRISSPAWLARCSPTRPWPTSKAATVARSAKPTRTVPSTGDGSRNCWPVHCSTCAGRNCPDSSSLWPESTPGGATSSSQSRSSAATASSSRCLWTWLSWWGSTGWPKPTWAAGSTPTSPPQPGPYGGADPRHRVVANAPAGHRRAQASVFAGNHPVRADRFRLRVTGLGRPSQ